VDLDGFGDELLANHLTVMKELVERDKNRPSVVMWSLANEPRYVLHFLIAHSLAFLSMLSLKGKVSQTFRVN
jgi:beta-galactosidase/beta-glucuronidase